MSDSEDQDRGVIAERLEKLFLRVQPQGRPYSYREAADGINARAGQAVIAHQYLQQIKEGRRRNPSIDKLEAIARWFGVSPAYFLDDEVAARTDEDLAAIALFRDAELRGIAARAEGLSRENRNLILTILEQMRDNEGLPPAGPEDTGEAPPGTGPTFLSPP